MKKEVIITNKLRIAITNQCNLSCFYCHNEGQEHCQAKKYLSLDYIKQLSKWFVDNDVYVQVLNITGGEPLLHKDLIPILDECRKFTDVIHLNTNATLLSKEKIDQLKAHGVTDIKVGIDSVFAKQSKPNIYTSPIGIEKVLENIKYANSIMGVELNTVLTHYNHEDIDKMIEFANEAKVNSIKVIQLFDFDPYKYNDRSDKEASLKTNDTKVQDYFFDVRQKYLDQAFHYDWYPSKGRVSIFLRREDGSEFELLFCEDVCNSGACGNMFTPIDADGNLKSACYGFIRIFDADASWEGKPTMRLAGVFNPTPNDTNLEDVEKAKKSRHFIRQCEPPPQSEKKRKSFWPF